MHGAKSFSNFVAMTALLMVFVGLLCQSCESRRITNSLSDQSASKNQYDQAPSSDDLPDDSELKERLRRFGFMVSEYT